jgi:hypothetical protein
MLTVGVYETDDFKFNMEFTAFTTYTNDEGKTPESSRIGILDVPPTQAKA